MFLARSNAWWCRSMVNWWRISALSSTPRKFWQVVWWPEVTTSPPQRCSQSLQVCVEWHACRRCAVALELILPNCSSVCRTLNIWFVYYFMLALLSSTIISLYMLFLKGRCKHCILPTWNLVILVFWSDKS